MSKPRYELHVFSDKRWLHEESFQDEATAIGQARVCLKQKAEAVRVILSKLRPDGNFAEKVIFEEKGSKVREEPVSVVPQDKAPMCNTLEDFYRVESRITIGRLFRKYLDKTELTPTELLHGGRHISRLTDSGMLVATAVSQVASLQVQAGGGDSKSRADLLGRLVEQVSQRARQADANRKLPSIKEHGLGGALERLEAASEAERDFIARVTLSREMSNCGHRVGKFALLLDLTSTESDDKALELLDGVQAELLDVQTVIKEILGAQRSLGSALMTLVDLCEGRLDTSQLPETDLGAKLNTVFLVLPLPASRQVLWERVMRELRGTQSLSRDGAEELDTAAALLGRFFSPTEGFKGSPELLDAFLARASHWIPGGKTEAEQKSFRSLAELLPTASSRLLLLVAAAGTRWGTKHADLLADTILAYFGDPPDLMQLGEKIGVKDRLAMTTRLHRAVLDSAFAEEVRDRLAGRIDDMAAKFLLDAAIIEKLDNEADPLRNRATRLVQFCASGILPEGKTSSLARERVVNHLRSKDFIIRFNEGVADPREGEQRIREFYALLASSGFGLAR